MQDYDFFITKTWRFVSEILAKCIWADSIFFNVKLRSLHRQQTATLQKLAKPLYFVIDKKSWEVNLDATNSIPI